MDLEKQLEIQRKETSSALRILLGYAEKLAAKNLGKNRESLEQLKKFSMSMVVMKELWRSMFSHTKECWQEIRRH